MTSTPLSSSAPRKRDRIRNFFSSLTCKMFSAPLSAKEMESCWEPFAHIPPPESSLDEARLELFVTLLSQPHINLDALRLESRNGIPQEVRSIAWQLLLGYLPSDTLLHTATLDDKRRQYRRLIRKHYSEKRLPSQVPPEQQQQQQQPPPSVNDVLDSVLGPDAVLSAPPPVIPTSTSEEALGSADAARLDEVAMMSVIGSAAFLQCESKFRLRDASRRELHAQIHVDVIRSVPENLERVFENLIVQELFERVLFLYTMEHHEGNYWQGLNDLVIPFICTFVARVFDCTVEALNSLKSDAFAHILFKSEVEADIYWCLTHYVNAIQTDSFVVGKNGFVSPNIMMERYKNALLIKNQQVLEHLQTYNIDTVFYGFRWMLCLLTRELPLRAAIRLWDCYIADAAGVASLHPCMCAVLLNSWAKRLFEKESFEETLMFLQQLPTGNWGPKEVALLVPEAYALRASYEAYQKLTHEVLTDIVTTLARLAVVAQPTAAVYSV